MEQDRILGTNYKCAYFVVAGIWELKLQQKTDKTGATVIFPLTKTISVIVECLVKQDLIKQM